MKTVTKQTMNIIVTLFTTMLCFTGLQACEEGEIDPQPDANPKITFELPTEWRPAQRGVGTLPYWSTYIPDSPEGIEPGEAKLDEDEQQHYWKFVMSEVGGEYGKDIPRGNSAKEAATWYYDHSAPGCTSENKCTVEPIRVDQYFGITAYTIEKINESGEPLYDGEYTTVFFEKDGHMFELGVRGDIKNPITQRTVEMVLETLKIGN